MTRLPWHPLLITACYLVFNVADTGVDPLAAGRAFLVALGFTALLQVAASVALRDGERGATLATAILLLAIFWVPIAGIADGYGRLPAVEAAVLAILVAAALILAARLVLRRGGFGGAPTGFLNAFSVALAVVVGAAALTAPGWAAGSSSSPRPADVPRASDAPDIFVLLVDGHPRPDSLLEQTGHDIGPFVDALMDVGFDVAPEARSNYRWTGASLYSILEMTLAASSAPEIASGGAGAPEIRSALADNAAFHTLRAHGYRVTAIGPPYEHVALRSADEFIDGGYLNSFECHLIRRTVVGPLAWAVSPSLVGDPRRGGVTQSLDEARAIAAAESEQPRFVWVHLPVPHIPVLWDAEGRAVDIAHGSDCAPQGIPVPDAADMRAAYHASLDHADGLVLEAIRDILTSASEPPVILLLSDHGGHLVGSAPDHRQPVHWRDSFAAFLAVHAPGEERPLPDDVSLANVLPSLFNAYLGAGIPLVDDRTFATDGTEAPEP